MPIDKVTFGSLNVGDEFRRTTVGLVWVKTEYVGLHNCKLSPGRDVHFVPDHVEVIPVARQDTP